jgi:sorbitol-6-phosphate 2-dehydrogenase
MTTEEIRELVNIIGPALRGLSAGNGVGGQYRFDDSAEAKAAKYPCYLEYAPAAGTSAEQIAADLREKKSDCSSTGPQTVIVKGVGVFSRIDDSLATPSGRAGGKVAIVTGAAQGFGLEIAQDLASQGATVVLADVNAAGAAEAAETICRQHGDGRAMGIAVDVTDGESVRQAVDGVVRAFGGLDVLISNAGVLRAESVKTQPVKDFDFVTAVNYKGYFLCTQAVAPIMAVQHIACADYTSDIIQISSKSGLVGSNRNGAYAGSKFGGIGLTQSFAMELIEDGVKVNSICPGNFFDGPLWSDPENGLFVQYLRTGKIPGAKTIEDVRRGYEAKVPMGRGCRTDDVMKAIYYAMEQKYETGQAIPVTGGQVMLS